MRQMLAYCYLLSPVHHIRRRPTQWMLDRASVRPVALCSDLCLRPMVLIARALRQRSRLHDNGRDTTLASPGPQRAPPQKKSHLHPCSRGLNR